MAWDNKSLEPTLLSRVFMRVFSALKHFKSGLVTLRQPQGGSTPVRWAGKH